MSKDNFINNYEQFFSAVDLCSSKGWIVPALTLIYSGIDTCAWLVYGDIKVETRYTQFIENYMYLGKKLHVKPIDLYAARCAILHTLTPQSDLSKKNKAVQLEYAWGSASVRDFELYAPKVDDSEEIYCIHLNDLFESFKFGIALLSDEVEKNREIKQRVENHYAHISIDMLNEYKKLTS